MRDVLVYVAGPLTLGDLAENVRRACEAGLALIEAGVPAYVPHTSVYLGQCRPGGGELARPETNPRGVSHEDWYALSLTIVRRCDALLRLPGESRGADLEEAEARRLGIPVFSDPWELLSWVDSYLARRGGPKGG